MQQICGPLNVNLGLSGRKKGRVKPGYTLFFYKNVVFPAQAEYSYFSADFRLKIFLYYS